ncbi:MAG: hypothetical protein ACRYFU_16140 [Janthinobacterium lividum]
MRRFTHVRTLTAMLPLVFAMHSAASPQERHGRGYHPPPPTAAVVVVVEKATNGKPLPNASVIFRAVKDDATDGNLEMKTDPDGHAGMDLLEVGSHVTVQVLAEGYATYAIDFDLTTAGRQILVKLQRPRAQVSAYGEESDRPAQVVPGVQEHHPGATPMGNPPATAVPTPASPASPLQTTPPANTPATVPGSNSVPAKPSTAAGSPQ